MPLNDVSYSDILLSWYNTHRRDLPWRSNRTAYSTWVSEVMLQQTRVSTVIPYYNNFMKKFPDIVSLAESKQDDVYKCWEGLGYYSRADNLRKGASYCMTHFQGKLPDEKSLLLQIPGIGPYIASAILSMAFNKTEPAVDGNLIRVISRLLAIPVISGDASAGKEIHSYATKMLSPEFPGDFNEAMMDLGSSICTPSSPSCEICPYNKICRAYLLGSQDSFPLKKAKIAVPSAQMTVFVLRKGNTVCIRQRPSSGLLANLFEFPMISGHVSKKELLVILSDHFHIYNENILSVEKLENTTHLFSHLRWNMRAYLIKIQAEMPMQSFPEPVSDGGMNHRFVTLEKAESLAFSSALRPYTSVIFNHL